MEEIRERELTVSKNAQAQVRTTCLNSILSKHCHLDQRMSLVFSLSTVHHSLYKHLPSQDHLKTNKEWAAMETIVNIQTIINKRRSKLQWFVCVVFFIL